VLERLHPGGRLVANAITLENSAECYQADSPETRSRSRQPTGGMPMSNSFKYQRIAVVPLRERPSGLIYLIENRSPSDPSTRP